MNENEQITIDRRRELLNDAASLLSFDTVTSEDGEQQLSTIDARQLRALRAQQEERQRLNNSKHGIDSPHNPENAVNAYRGTGYKQMNEFARLFFTDSAKNYRREGFVIDRSSDDDDQRAQTRELFEYYSADSPLVLGFTQLLNQAILDSRLPLSIHTYRGMRDLQVARPTGEIERTIGFGKSRQIVKETQYESLPVPYFESQLQAGNVVRFYGFLSTSLDPNIAVAAQQVGVGDKNRARMMLLPQYTDSTAQCCLLQFELPAGYPALYTRAMNEEELILPYKLSNGKVPEFLVTKVFRARHLYRPTSALFECEINDTECIQRTLSSNDQTRTIDLRVVRLRPL